MTGPSADQASADRPAADRQLGFLWLAVALALVLLAPVARHLASGLGACPVKTVVGFPCPTCGTARAALALAELDVAGAFIRYPLPALAWTSLVAGGLVAGWLAWRRRPLPRLGRLPGWARLGIVGAVLANWAYSIATGV